MSNRTLGAGRFLQLVEVNNWEYVERRNATGVVAIAAITRDKRLLLVEQFRHPVGRSVIELPAGLCGDDAGATGEPLTEAARRELLEETGYAASAGDGGLELLFTVPSSAGLTSEVVTIFGARDVEKVAAGGGIEGEHIIMHAPMLDELEHWLSERVREGALIDSKIFLALHFARRCS